VVVSGSRTIRTRDVGAIDVPVPVGKNIQKRTKTAFTVPVKVIDGAASE
jgi:hypothetical protein